jgi:hypothetical protein
MQGKGGKGEEGMETKSKRLPGRSPQPQPRQHERYCSTATSLTKFAIGRLAAVLRSDL